MVTEKDIAEDAGTIRHRIIDVIEGLKEELKDPAINAQGRAAIFPMIGDGLVIAAALTVDQSKHPITMKVMHQADIWLSHAEPVLDGLRG